MTKERKVKGAEHLVRDPFTGHIRNTDRDAYLNYMRRKEMAIEDKEKMARMEREISELKNLVKKLVKDK